MSKNDMPKDWVNQVKKICKERDISYTMLVQILKNSVIITKP